MKFYKYKLCKINIDSVNVAVQESKQKKTHLISFLLNKANKSDKKIKIGFLFH